MNARSHSKAIRAISISSAALVIMLAVAAFALSFHALRELANQHGYANGMGWIFPLVLDGAVAVFSMAALRGQLRGEKARYEMALVLAAVLASSAFNVCHAPTDPLSRIMAVVPPVCLFLAFEVLVRQLRSELAESGPEDVTGNIQPPSASNRSNTPVQLREDVEHDLSLNLEASSAYSDAQSAPKKKQSRRSKMERRRNRIASLNGKGLGASEIAKMTGASSATIRRDLAALGLQA